MKKLIALGVVTVFAVMLAALHPFKPSPLPAEHREASAAAAERVAAIELAQAELEAVATPAAESAADPAGEAPEVFRVRFECDHGEFIAEFKREWAPLGVQRVYDLVEDGFFEEARFFRVIDNFMAQFGIAGDPAMQAKWRERPLGVEPVKQSNSRGMITFAMAGRAAAPLQTTDNRTTQLFINFRDNSNLDEMGFAPVGRVVEGMDVVDAIYSGYGEGAPSGRGPNQGILQQQGNAYLEAEFPNLTYIKRAVILTDDDEAVDSGEEVGDDDDEEDEAE
jgi:peptidyl-prolyl cis-trans isomerase A (cyclophilin A)